MPTSALLFSFSLLLSVLLSTMLHSVQAAEQQHFQISTLAPMPIAVQEIYPVLHQDEIYLAGGISSALPLMQGQMTDALQIYNPAQNSWRLGPRLPEPRHHAMLISTEDALWIFGGFVKDPTSLTANAALSSSQLQNAKDNSSDFWQQGNWMASADVLKLVNSSNNWQKVATLPAPLAETVSFVLGDHIHLVSGRSPQGGENSEWSHHQDTNVHYAFNLKTLKTHRLAPVAAAKNSAALAVVREQPYWIGGRHRSLGNLASSARFNPQHQSWQQIADLPQAQAGLAAASLGDKLYVFGGEGANNASGVFAQIWAYDTATLSWLPAGQMQPARHGHGAVALKDAIYILGGATAQGLRQTTALLQRYQLAR